MKLSIFVAAYAMVFVLLGTGTPALRAASTELLQEEGVDAILLDAVRTAYRYDLFNIHCRGFLSSNQLNDINKLVVAKYGLTVSEVITNYASTDERSFLRELEKVFYDTLSEYGGCRAAKRRGLLEQIQTHYTGLLQLLQQAP